MLVRFRVSLMTLAAAGLCAWVFFARPQGAVLVHRPPVPQSVAGDNIVLRWNSALLEAVRRTRFAPMRTARVLAIVHTAMFDAWAAYQPETVGVHWNGDLRRPAGEQTAEAEEIAINVAAYRTLADLFPTETAAVFDPRTRTLRKTPLRYDADLFSMSWNQKNEIVTGAFLWRASIWRFQLQDGTHY